MAKQFFLDGRPHNGKSYPEYMDMFKNEIDTTNIDKLDKSSRELFEYKKLNFQRSKRIENSYIIAPKLNQVIGMISGRQLWMVLAESWCGDSAQNLPYIAKIAEVNPNINLRIILRDTNLDIMDEYLTNGSRIIPKLVAFDYDGIELFTWGPRPKEAQELILKWKNEGIVKPELYEKLHLWYGKNRGKSIENEFINILSKVTTRITSI